MRISADGTASLVGRHGSQMDLASCGRTAGVRVAYAYGKTTHVRLSDVPPGLSRAADRRSIAFAPKGLRIASRATTGVSLHWVAMAGQPVDLEWKGAHTAVTFSPDGRFVVTAMQENALHGWKLDAKPGAEARHDAHDRLSGEGEVAFLVSEGQVARIVRGAAAIVWPFQGQGRAMGRRRSSSAPRQHHGDDGRLPPGGRYRAHRL